MRVVYLEGKRTNFCFMPFGEVFLPEEVQRLLPKHIRCACSDIHVRFYRRENSLKAILRKIEKQNYPAGTIVRVPNWYVGYANILVYV